MDSEKTSTTEQLDAKEILSLVESAAEQFESAAESFMGIGAIFEAITALAPMSTISRLAELGKGLCEQHEFEFVEQQFAFAAHVDRFGPSLRPMEAQHHG